MARVDDGFPTLIQFLYSGPGGLPGETMDVIWEKRVKPPGIQGGGGNDTTTMRNTKWRTTNPKKLRTLSEMTLTVSYDPKIFGATGVILKDNGALQRNQPIAVYFPDGSAWAFWGFMDSFEPAEISEGSQPEAEVRIIPTNQDLEGAEQAPAYFADATELDYGF